MITCVINYLYNIRSNNNNDACLNYYTLRLNAANFCNGSEACRCNTVFKYRGQAVNYTGERTTQIVLLVLMPNAKCHFF